MNRRQFLSTLSLGAAALALPGRSTAHRRTASRRQPNILLIVSDDQGYNDLGCYGGTEIKTPNLDRLAAAGVRLTSFYVTWPACTPSRGSLLTSRYPQRNGTYDMFRNDKVDYDYKYGPDEYAVSWEQVGGMDTREVLIPRVLAQAGYASGIFGKWDLGQLHRFLPLQRGFDEFYGYTNTGIDYFTHERAGATTPQPRTREPTPPTSSNARPSDSSRSTGTGLFFATSHSTPRTEHPISTAPARAHRPPLNTSKSTTARMTPKTPTRKKPAAKDTWPA